MFPILPGKPVLVHAAARYEQGRRGRGNVEVLEVVQAQADQTGVPRADCAAVVAGDDSAGEDSLVIGEQDDGPGV